MSTPRRSLSFGAVAVVAALVLGAAACGDDGGDGGSDGDALASEGRNIAARSGCAGCHGADGQGGIGPAWVGLAGSEVELVDGTTVVADTAYLTASIKTPDAQKVDGYQVAMPVNQLSDPDIAKIVAYIESLGAAEGGAPVTTLVLPTAPTIPVATAAPGG